MYQKAYKHVTYSSAAAGASTLVPEGTAVASSDSPPPLGVSTSVVFASASNALGASVPVPRGTIVAPILPHPLSVLQQVLLSVLPPLL